ncbi:hypothetical protein ACWCYY_38625 [Kitasatospora sp. NPDC001664]
MERQLAAYNIHDIEAFLAPYAESAVVNRRDATVLHGLAADSLRLLVAYRVRDDLIDRVDFLG